MRNSARMCAWSLDERPREDSETDDSLEEEQRRWPGGSRSSGRNALPDKGVRRNGNEGDDLVHGVDDRFHGQVRK